MVIYCFLNIEAGISSETLRTICQTILHIPENRSLNVNILADSTKAGEFHDQLSDCQLHKEDFASCSLICFEIISLHLYPKFNFLNECSNYKYFPRLVIG
jgi:hypothetical protein